MKYLRDLNKDEIIELYNQGYLDTQIAEKLETNSNVIYNFRRTNKLPNNRGALVAKRAPKLWELCRKKTPIKEMAKILGIGESIIYGFLQKNNIGLRDFKIPKYKIGKRERNIIIGILLGDGSLWLPKGKNTDAYFYTRHSKAQKEYSKYIFECFRTLNARIFNVKIKGHVLEGKQISSCVQTEVRLGVHPFLTELHNAFYPNGKKILNFKYLSKYYNAEALAFHFMDDGSTVFYKDAPNGFVLCTDGFTYEDVLKFAGFLEGRFHLNCGVSFCQGKPRVRIYKSSVQHFIQIIKPYICDNLQYKIA